MDKKSLMLYTLDGSSTDSSNNEYQDDHAVAEEEEESPRHSNNSKETEDSPVGNRKICIAGTDRQGDA